MPSEEHVSPAIDHVAKDHLGLVDARRELREALAVIGEFGKRVAIVGPVQSRAQCTSWCRLGQGF